MSLKNNRIINLFLTLNEVNKLLGTEIISERFKLLENLFYKYLILQLFN